MPCNLSALNIIDCPVELRCSELVLKFLSRLLNSQSVSVVRLKALRYLLEWLALNREPIEDPEQRNLFFEEIDCRGHIRCPC